MGSGSDELSSKDGRYKQTESVMVIENFVRGAHNVCHRREYEMPDNFMTDSREILVY
jgi:hypothetical protein